MKLCNCYSKSEVWRTWPLSSVRERVTRERLRTEQHEAVVKTKLLHGEAVSVFQKLINEEQNYKQRLAWKETFRALHQLRKEELSNEKFLPSQA